jgi:hypothetical protein
MPGLTPAATASGGAPGGSGNRIAAGDGMRSANVPYGGGPDAVKTGSPPAVRATPLSPGMTGQRGRGRWRRGGPNWSGGLPCRQRRYVVLRH